MGEKYDRGRFTNMAATVTIETVAILWDHQKWSLLEDPILYTPHLVS